MSEVIKAQAQKVYDARKAKNAAMSRITLLQSGTQAWGEAVDVLRDTVNAVALEEGLLSSLVIEEQLGLFSV
jgi:hypothetical protein